MQCHKVQVYQVSRRPIVLQGGSQNAPEGIEPINLMSRKQVSCGLQCYFRANKKKENFAPKIFVDGDSMHEN